MSIIISDPLEEGSYRDNGRKLSHSAFNTKWFNELNISPKIIVDIGSYDCGDAIRLSQAFPDARVYSFEGCPGRNEIINGYIAQYRVVHFPMVVSDKVGETEWYSASCHNQNKEKFGAQGSILRHTEHYKQTFPFIKQAESTKVECTTISHVFGSADIDLAHIDVEGAEKYVIAGFGNCRPRLVFVECILGGDGWENCTSKEDLDAILIPMGYSLIKDTGFDRLYLYENQSG